MASGTGTASGTEERSLEPLGEVFTRRWVVDWMLDLAGYSADADLASMKVVEPSCGSGAFLIPVVERLLDSREESGASFDQLHGAIWACDLHLPSVERSSKAVEALLLDRGATPDVARELVAGWIHHTDFLLTDQVPECDLVVGNPPYVRHDEIPEHLADQYRRSWSTMRGRCDLYIPFFERGLTSLRDGGSLAFICADRWMRNNYGTQLRRLVHDSFNVATVVRMHQVDAFEEEVDAYPAITVIRPGEQAAGLLVDVDRDFTAENVAATTDAMAAVTDTPIEVKKATVARVPTWFGPGPWPEGSVDTIESIARWESTLEPIEDVLRQTQVGIGVASGADKSYIVKGDPPDIEEDRVVPMVMSRHISDGTLNWTPTYLANPWNGTGLVDLAKYPKLASFLEPRRDQIAARHIAKKNPATWFRTIDRVHGWLTGTPKILLADMKDRMTPVVDHGSYYPHHNLYWITSSAWDIEVLAGLLLSDQAELFIRAYCVKMRGGTLRMQAQYLRLIRTPQPRELSEADAKAFRRAYVERDRERATATARKFYG